MATRAPQIAAAALALAAVLSAPAALAAPAAPPRPAPAASSSASAPRPAAPAWPAPPSARPEPSPGSAMLPALARQLGVSPQRLEAAVRAAALERWRAYARDHAVPPERAAAIEKRIESAPVTLRAHFGHRMPGGLLGAAATYLGLDRAALAAELRHGKSLAEIAAAQGKTAAGLRDALYAAASEELQRRVTAGEMTPETRDRLLQDLSGRLPALIEHRMPPPPGAEAQSRTQPLGAGSASPPSPRTAP